MSYDEKLSILPLSALVAEAARLGIRASIAHKREDIVNAILNGSSLCPDPIITIRNRVHRAIRTVWNEVGVLIDAECADCFRQGQRKCLPLRAIADYLNNLEYIEEICS